MVDPPKELFGQWGQLEGGLKLFQITLTNGMCVFVPQIKTLAEMGFDESLVPPDKRQAFKTSSRAFPSMKSRFMAMSEADQRAVFANNKLFDFWKAEKFPLEAITVKRSGMFVPTSFREISGRIEQLGGVSFPRAEIGFEFTRIKSKADAVNAFWAEVDPIDRATKGRVLVRAEDLPKELRGNSKFGLGEVERQKLSAEVVAKADDFIRFHAKGKEVPWYDWNEYARTLNLYRRVDVNGRVYYSIPRREYDRLLKIAKRKDIKPGKIIRKKEVKPKISAPKKQEVKPKISAPKKPPTPSPDARAIIDILRGKAAPPSSRKTIAKIKLPSEEKMLDDMIRMAKKDKELWGKISSRNMDIPVGEIAAKYQAFVLKKVITVGDEAAGIIEKVARKARIKLRKLQRDIFKLGNKTIALVEKIEPEITDILKGMASKHGGSMVSLDKKFKTLKSLIRKMGSDGVEKGWNIAQIEKFDLNDVLRYTMQISHSNYVDAVLGTLENLAGQGFKVERIRNFWLISDQYKGINVVLRAANGQRWELQFHTLESLEIKAKAHKLYEIFRLTSTSPARRKELAKEMADLWKSVITPKNISKIKQP